MVRRSAYTLRYGESRQNDMLVYFNDDETILENLSKIIPSAIQRGFLPPECSADSVKLIHRDQSLNLHVRMQEQTVTVAERAILIIHDLSSTVRIKINYKPDNHGERTETVNVNPNKILKDEISKFLGVVSKDYTFYKRKPKKYCLVTAEGKKANLNKSLVVQGIETGFDATLEPRLIFRWPPGMLTLGAASVIVLVVLGFVLWSVYVNYLRRPPVVERFYVTFEVDVEARLLTPDTTVAFLPGAPVLLALDPGVHEFEIMPKDYPIIPYVFDLVSEGAVRDSLTKAVYIQQMFPEAPPLAVVITGYQGEPDPDHRLKSGLSINGHERELDAFGTLRINLHRGEYEISYDLPAELLDINNMRFDPKVLRPSSFRFGFSGLTENATALTFRYLPSQ
jgi:hypothetical protein